MKGLCIGLLVVGALWSGGWCFFVSVMGKSAIHEILGAVYLLIFAVCIAGLGVIAAIGETTERLPKPRPRQPT